MKEIKENVNVEETKGTETVVLKENEIVTKEEKVKLFIERQKFVSGNDGKEYYNYFLNGIARGRNVKVDFAPRDKGGYEALDLVFGDEMKAELIISEESMKDNDGKINRYTVYTVQTVDTNGLVYECNVKPARDSDKALLGMVLATLSLKK